MAAKITNFFERVDEPHPIHWTSLAEPPSKKPRRGPGTLEHSIPLEQISFFPNLHCKPFHLSACASLWLRPVRAILYTGMDDLYDVTFECARGKFFPVWRKIRNYRFGIFNFNAELEWCKFRALMVATINYWNSSHSHFRVEGVVVVNFAPGKFDWYSWVKTVNIKYITL